MILAILAAAAASSAAPVATETPNLADRAIPAHCQTFQKTVQPTPRVFRPNLRLADQPPADLHLLVDRRVAGCPVPTIVRYDVEGSGRAARPGKD